MLKVALINPPQATNYPVPPIGLALIAAVLEREGYKVAILDANALRLKPEDISSYITDSDVVGLTAMTPTINMAIAIARQLKQAKPNLSLILGGSHATILPEETLATAPEIDIIVKGEGEQTIIELLQALEHGQPLGNIPGISYRRDGVILNNPARATNVELDSLPFLAYHLLPWQKYKPFPPFGKASPFAAIITSRGCPYKCSFCSKPIFGYKFRAQSPERVIDEISYYKEKFGIRELDFCDDVFTLDKKRAHAIADEIIRRKLKILWTCETRVNLVDKDLLRHLKAAGCYAVSYGIESASQEILDTLNKGTTLDQAEEAIRITKKVGLKVIGYFMIGSPGETPETISQTIQFAKKLKFDFAQFAITTPFPGTQLYELYLRNKKCRASWDDFFYEGAGSKVTPVFESDKLSRVDLQHWVRRAYREFYLRPSYLWQRIRQSSSIGDLKVNFRGFLMLLGNISGRQRDR